MRDSNFIRENGEYVPVSKLSTAEVIDNLRRFNEMVVVDAQPGETLATVKARLEIELIIRSLP